MRKVLPLLAILALLLPACKDGEKSGTTGSAKQVEYACTKCDKTKTAPADQAPS